MSGRHLRYMVLMLVLGASVQLVADEKKEDVKVDASLTIVDTDDKLVPLKSGVFYPEKIVNIREKGLLDLRRSNPDAYAYLIGLCKGNVGLLSPDSKNLLIQLGFLKWDGTVFEDVREVVKAGSPRGDTIFEWQSPIEE